MADPLIEDIEEELETILAGVTVDNGYQFDITALRPTFRNKYDPADSLAVLQWDNAEPNEGISAPGNPAIKGWTGVWTVDLIVAADESSTTPYFKRIHQMRADVEKAIAVGLAEGSALNALIETWEIQGAQTFTLNSGASGVRVAIALGFRHSENDPYAQR